MPQHNSQPSGIFPSRSKDCPFTYFALGIFLEKEEILVKQDRQGRESGLLFLGLEFKTVKFSVMIGVALEQGGKSI